MLVRLVLPLAAVALGFAAPAQLAAQETQTQIRPAQAQPTACDDLIQRVELRMSTALAVNLPGARDDLAEARELCNSGQEAEGIPILRGLLNSMNSN
jgi:hypothetical protein